MIKYQAPVNWFMSKSGLDGGLGWNFWPMNPLMYIPSMKAVLNHMASQAKEFYIIPLSL